VLIDVNVRVVGSNPTISFSLFAKVGVAQWSEQECPKACRTYCLLPFLNKKKEDAVYQRYFALNAKPYADQLLLFFLKVP
jgi:hypothetical protein